MNEATAEVGSAARKKRRKKAEPPTPKESKTGLEVVTPGNVEEALSGPDNDGTGAHGLNAEHKFELDYTDVRGYHWTGSFTCHIQYTG